MSKAQAMLAWRAEEAPPNEPEPNGGRPGPAPDPDDGKPRPNAMAVVVGSPPARLAPRPPRPSRQVRGPLWRWVRQAEVAAPRCWRPWWLLGLVEVVSYPHRAADRVRFEPRIRASCGLPARPPMLILLAARP